MKVVEIDRLGMRARPPGTPVMHQNWKNLLIIYWPMDPAIVRPLIPSRLEIDTYEGKPELELRHLPCAMSISLLCHQFRDWIPFWNSMSGLICITKANPASGSSHLTNKETTFISSPNVLCRRKPLFRAHWRIGVRLREPHLDSRAFFLVERYALFAGSTDSLQIRRIYHHPWILDEAFIMAHKSTMLTLLEIPEPTAEPLAHLSRSLNVDVWALTLV